MLNLTAIINEIEAILLLVKSLGVCEGDDYGDEERYEIQYQGHNVVYQWYSFVGEALFIDNVRVWDNW